MTVFKDMRGVTLEIGDYICYGKSDRNNPVKLGTIKVITKDGVSVLGDGNAKLGKLSSYDLSKRVLVLPESYRIVYEHNTI